MPKYTGAPVIALIGRSGAGKDTLLPELLSAYHAVNFSTGDLFRTLKRQLTPLGNFARGILDEDRWLPLPEGLPRALFEDLAIHPTACGVYARRMLDEKRFTFVVYSDTKPNRLPPDWLAVYLWLKEFEPIPATTTVISSAAPRRISEATTMDELMPHLDRPPIIPVYIHVEEDEAVTRLINRRICNDCKRPTSVLALASAGANCEFCHGVLFTRDDDQDPEDRKARMAYFGQSVVPVIEHFQSQDRLLWVNGERLPDEVADDAKTQIDRVIATYYS
ncbi:MAG: nucleoside monophosphate kinase [Parcubacteria group bacterium]|nr:nucleoside monophosphate kinase [Parcubacteria group bacterium]